MVCIILTVAVYLVLTFLKLFDNHIKIFRFKVPFHLRSSKSSTSFSSPSATFSNDLKHDRSSPDWTYDHNSRNSSLNATKGRPDPFGCFLFYE